MHSGQKLRQLLAGPKAVLMPGAANALTARIAEEAGFRVVLFTGAGFANLELGDPDLGLTTMTEVAQQIGRMAEAVGIPIVADADTGFGNPLNVLRTVRELERAGAAAIILEDQVSPKRCGHFEGKQVIGQDEMVMKLVAALRGAIRGIQVVLQGLARDGSTEKVLDQMVSWEERQRLVHLPEYNTLEARYAAPPAATRT